ncbi:MAG: hypothetical protein JWQ03_3257, partial [Variovorax sp.]|nr:hypothetical protein [Variovorax sp.]
MLENIRACTRAAGVGEGGGGRGYRLSVIGYRLSVISYQLSVISYQ